MKTTSILSFLTVTATGFVNGQNVLLRRRHEHTSTTRVLAGKLQASEPEELHHIPLVLPEEGGNTTFGGDGRRAGSCPSFHGYVFWLTYDSVGSDFDYKDPSSVPLTTLIELCSRSSSCKGLNTNGYLKSYIKPLRSWYRWTLEPCQGLYIKTHTSFVVNGHNLSSKEVRYLKWVAQWTVPNFGMSAYVAIRDYIAKGTTCPTGRAWQVGIAAVQVPNYNQARVESRATSVYGQDAETVLGRSAHQAGYNPGTDTYNGIVASQGNLRKAWLLKSHLVGFYFVAEEVDNECLISNPKHWCYGTYGGTCIRCGWYSPDSSSISSCIDEVMVLLQSLTDG